MKSIADGLVMMTASNKTANASVAPAPGILQGRDILCFSQDWRGDPLSKTHLMRLLARDNRVLWVNSIGYRAPTASRADISRAFRKLIAATMPLQEPEPNIRVLNPLAIPAYGRPGLRMLNRKLLRFQVRRAMHQLGFRRPINWVFNPAAAVVAGALDEELLIYHCVDEYTAFTGVSARALGELEEQLLRQADMVIVSADRLYQSKSRLNPRTLLVRHGVDYSHFRRALDAATVVPEDIARLPRPILGFFGLIADWIDLELLTRVAERYPHASVVLLGKVTTDVSSLACFPNIHLLGQKPYSLLPSYCRGFDVALMPFRLNELTLNANPLKVREYLAAGLPVVSTAIPEVEILKVCRIGRDHEGFLREIDEALSEPGPSAMRSETVRGESWEARLNDIRAYVEQYSGSSSARSRGNVSRQAA
jgi:glycosyltransferase involved in cell wall biosynthesis